MARRGGLQALSRPQRVVQAQAHTQPFQGPSKECRNKDTCYYLPPNSSLKAVVPGTAHSHLDEVMLSSQRVRENGVNPEGVANEGERETRSIALFDLSGPLGKSIHFLFAKPN